VQVFQLVYEEIMHRLHFHGSMLRGRVRIGLARINVTASNGWHQTNVANDVPDCLRCAADIERQPRQPFADALGVVVSFMGGSRGHLGNALSTRHPYFEGGVPL
jgi:hypothetical protein